MLTGAVKVGRVDGIQRASDASAWRDVREGRLAAIERLAEQAHGGLRAGRLLLTGFQLAPCTQWRWVG